MDARVLERDRGLADFLYADLSATELVNRRSISIITLLLTYQCPAQCDHCVFESSPHNTATIDPAVARTLIEAAARQKPPPVLGFSGGEPFLQLRMLRELTSFASGLGMASEVVSSSAWAKDEAYAAAVLKDLASRGLQSYCTSVDRFHTPFVEGRKMRTALLAARAAGMHVIVNTQVDALAAKLNGGDVEQYLSRVLDLPSDELREFQINALITTPVGRGRHTDIGYHYPDKNFREGCPMATEVVTLSPHGLLYPCCGMVVGEQPESADLFIQDDLAQRSVDEVEAMLDALKGDLFFRLLQYVGPYNILAEVLRRNPHLRGRSRYTGACDVCLEFTSNPGIAQATRALLQELAQRLQS
jgi:organic radical activating enzyme